MADDGRAPAAFQFVDMSEQGRHNQNTRSIVRSRTALNSHRSGNRKRSSRARGDGKHVDNSLSNDDAAPGDQSQSTQQSVTRVIHRPRLLVRKPLQSVNNFAPWPVQPEPAFPPLLRHLWTVYENGLMSGQTDLVEARKGMHWVQRKNFTNSTYFYLNLLSSALDLNLRTAFPENLIFDLKSKLFASLHRDLDRQDEVDPALLVLAVARLSMMEAPEARHGSTEALARGRVHYTAYRTLTKERGGPKELNLPPALRTFLSWCETTMQNVFELDSAESPTTTFVADVEQPVFVRNFLPFHCKPRASSLDSVSDLQEDSP